MDKGWIIIRTIKQFQILHQNLVEMVPEISEKFKKIPTINRNLISKSFDQNKVKAIRANLDEYLKVKCYK